MQDDWLISTSYRRSTLGTPQQHKLEIKIEIFPSDDSKTDPEGPKEPQNAPEDAEPKVYCNKDQYFTTNSSSFVNNNNTYSWAGFPP